ncbi:hypothetical protein WI71_25605 [Burkholderia diffusa]|nr:hypothetical protein WI71_25605 [Burkholderia diffusa]
MGVRRKLRDADDPCDRASVDNGTLLANPTRYRRGNARFDNGNAWHAQRPQRGRPVGWPATQRPSRTLPIGVYAAESDVDRYEIASPALRTCIALAVDRAVPPPRPVTLAVVAA